MPTRAQLRTRARATADQDSATFPTDAQYNEWLNEAMREVWTDCVTAGWPVNYATLTVSANGASQYTVGSAFSARAVWYVDGSNRIEIPRIDEGQKASALSMTGAVQAVGYEVVADTSSGMVLRLYPASVSGTYEVEYIPLPTDWSSDSDTWGGPPRSDQLIVLQAAAKGCRKESRRGDAADLLADYDKLLEKIQSSQSWYDQRNSAKIRDTQSEVRRDPFAFQVVRGDF